jgi:PTH2 family peptidyl-tRNA hydrolase
MLKQVFIINKDLEMGKGKIAAQVAHGEVFYMLYLDKPYSSGHTEFAEWIKDGVMKKIVLKASEDVMTAISQSLNKQRIWYYAVYDLGLTQVAKGSLTCIVVEPLEEEQTQELFGNLKLL